MAIAGNQDLYVAVRETVAALRDARESELASELLNALAISTMPGEILGEIRLVLQRVRAHPVYKSLDVRRRVDDGIDYVDRVLG
jgi:glycogen debranching enzyme